MKFIQKEILNFFYSKVDVSLFTHVFPVTGFSVQKIPACERLRFFVTYPRANQSFMH